MIPKNPGITQNLGAPKQSTQNNSTCPVSRLIKLTQAGLRVPFQSNFNIQRHSHHKDIVALTQLYIVIICEAKKSGLQGNDFDVEDAILVPFYLFFNCSARSKCT